MKPHEVRNLFLEFFKARGHKIVESAPVVPHGDPTLLFTNAGMNQFKDVFLGTGRRSYNRAANTQKCIRVSGKHNDLEAVGKDGYHHTFFEMLGNWSFGDYFKKEAVQWAWELMTSEYKLPPERLYATVFAGDESAGLDPDEECEEIWREATGICKDHVLRFGKEENFWEMGDTGPCGPCSEIHVDLGPSACDNPTHRKDGSDCRVNGGCARFIEVWNLVFIQYNRLEGGGLERLPANHVDTGMGFERLCEIMRVKDSLVRGEPFNFSNYNTELFGPIFEALYETTGVSYSPLLPQRQLVACRAIADHIRALCVAIADGVMPDKKMRGSVLRGLLRRASCQGSQALETRGPFLYKLVKPVAEVYATTFPEIWQRREHIRLVIEAEEKNFARTIETGLRRFRALVEKTKAADKCASVLDGREAFRLYHQDGFLRELIDQMCTEEGLVVDEEGWREAEEEHRKVSASDALTMKFDTSEITGLPPTAFAGYWDMDGAHEEGLEARASILKVIGNEAVVLDRTPFYAEGGGQVGDTGVIEGEGFRFSVHDTGKIGDIIVHYGEIEEADLANLPSSVVARVDGRRRLEIAANHTATHLLHWALRATLGEHATQQGSLVHPSYLRFDFTHPSQVAPHELQEIERKVNEKVFEDLSVTISLRHLEEARREGAVALFGERYGEFVRVVKIGDFSMELCGGTHLKRTGQIGYFKIISEGAVQSGVRRIVAITRSRAVEESWKERTVLLQLARQFSCSPEDIPAKAEKLIEQAKWRQRGAWQEQAEKREIGPLVDFLWQEVGETIGGVRLIVQKGISPDIRSKAEAGRIADALRERKEPVAGILVGKSEDNIHITCFASPLLTPQPVNCGEILQAALKEVGRKGGGRPDFAQTGWKEFERVDLGRFLSVARKGLVQAIEKGLP